jgi:heme A synthase
MHLSRLARFAWIVLAYNLAVVVWGAYVRASGSGAGCGSHWPMCNGEVVPHAPRIATIIELTHRVTSLVALVLVVALAVMAFRTHPKSSCATKNDTNARTARLVRRGSALSVVFIATEALLGAALVLFSLVAKDASMKRALSMTLHLTNTFFLLACLTLTALWASGGPPLRLSALRERREPLALLIPAIAGTLVLGMSGGIAALGDTLFPVKTFAEGIAQDLSPGAHLFIRLRALHPFVATALGLYIVIASHVLRSLCPSPRVRACARTLVIVFVAQFALGLANMILLAPIATQLAHLLLADAVWILLVVLAAFALGESREVRASDTQIARAPARAHAE